METKLSTQLYAYNCVGGGYGSVTQPTQSGQLSERESQDPSPHLCLPHRLPRNYTDPDRWRRCDSPGEDLTRPSWSSPGSLQNRRSYLMPGPFQWLMWRLWPVEMEKKSLSKADPHRVSLHQGGLGRIRTYVDRAGRKDFF